MNQITANDLKVRGIGAIEAVLADRTEATISVRDEDRFVVMDVARIPLPARMRAGSRAGPKPCRSGRRTCGDRKRRRTHAAHGAGLGARREHLTPSRACLTNSFSPTATPAAHCAFSSATRNPRRRYGKTLALLEANPHHLSPRLHAVSNPQDALAGATIWWASATKARRPGEQDAHQVFLLGAGERMSHGHYMAISLLKTRGWAEPTVIGWLAWRMGVERSVCSAMGAVSLFVSSTLL